MNKIGMAYRQNQYEGMTPERITLALFDGALRFIEAAKTAISKGDQVRRGERIGRAMAVIGELQATLDLDQGGEVAINLMALYDYLMRTLLMANLHGEVERLQEVQVLLREVRDGWAEMVDQVAASRASQEGASSSAGESRVRVRDTV